MEQRYNMSKLENALEQIIEAILDSPEYKRYDEQRHEVNKYPELKAQIDEFRTRNYILQMDEDAELILKVIEEYDGVLPYNDKASPEIISRDFKMSKNAFKRGVGRLLKSGKIEITEKSIRIK